MKPLVLALCLGAALSLVHTPVCAGAPQYDTGDIPNPHIALPDGDISAMIFLISGPQGWNEKDDARLKDLTGKGAAVVGIDYPSYMASLAGEQKDCIYTIADIESLSEQIQRIAGNNHYHAPILAGEGDAGTLVLAMAAQSPFATIGEVVAVDPTTTVPIRKVLCTPAEKTVNGDGVVYGLTDGPLPAPVSVVETPAMTAEGKAHVEALLKEHPDISVDTGDDSDGNLLTATLSDVIDTAAHRANSLGLPLTELEAKPALDTMAIIYSGDGGWRDIDMRLGEFLQKQGVPTVGLDSLRYFWTKQTSQRTASDLARIIETYRKKWKVRNVMLLGYSFGADVLPPAFNRLTPQQKAYVKQISLLSLSHSVDYEISISGWLGKPGSFGGGKTEDAIGKIEPKLVQCVYGIDDTDDDACPDLKSKGYDVIALPGDHHFNEDYDKVGEIVLDGLQKRLADSSE